MRYSFEYKFQPHKAGKKGERIYEKRKNEEVRAMGIEEFGDQVTIPDRQLGLDSSGIYCNCPICGKSDVLRWSPRNGRRYLICTVCNFTFLLPKENDDDLHPGEHICRYNVDGMCEICGNVRYSSYLHDDESGV